MALTKDQLKAIIVSRLAPKLRADLTWAQLVAAVGAATPGKKAEIVAAIKDGNARQVGDIMLGLTAAHLTTMAEAEADTALADDSLTLAELERVL